MRKFWQFAFTACALFTVSCSSPQWCLEESHLFSLARLTLAPDDPIDGIKFEILFVEGEIGAYITPLWELSAPSEFMATFRLDRETIQQTLFTRPGRCRLKIPQNLTAKIIESLQEGFSVGIMIDGRNQLIPADQFCSLFHRIAGGTPYFLSQETHE